MLHNLLSEYLKEIESAVTAMENVYVEHYAEEILTDYRLNLRIRIRFINGHFLELNEAVIAGLKQIEQLDYRYHFQDKQNNLIFRYDNTPHFPKLESFPHHKHLSNQVINSNKPSIIDVIQEACHLAR